MLKYFIASYVRSGFAKRHSRTLKNWIHYIYEIKASVTEPKKPDFTEQIDLEIFEKKLMRLVHVILTRIFEKNSLDT